MAEVGYSPDDSQIGEVSSSKFRLVRQLGAGGMGAVFEAEHLLTKRLGALKLLYKDLTKFPEVVERFMREASAAGRVNSPHIVETFDAGQLESGHPYIFMELLNGLPFDQYLSARGRLPFDEALGICIQAASGLAAAHASGIIHRDIKPANLFLVDQRNTLVKLLDFGISKFHLRGEIRSVTEEGVMLGTPHYMPYEQLMGAKTIDEGVDIYALGIVLYEAVTGMVPFRASTLPELGVRVYGGSFTPVSHLRDDTPPGFDDIIASCLAVNRAERHDNMTELLNDLVALSSRGATVSAATLSIGPVAHLLSTKPPPGDLMDLLPGGTVPRLPKSGISQQSDITLPPSQPADVVGRTRAKQSQRPLLVGAVVVATAVAGYVALRSATPSKSDEAPPSSAAPVIEPKIEEHAQASAPAADTAANVNLPQERAEPGTSVAPGALAATSSNSTLRAPGGAAAGAQKAVNALGNPAASAHEKAAETGSLPVSRPNRPLKVDELKRENPFQ